jgi:large subunit ribosomal protein L25
MSPTADDRRSNARKAADTGSRTMPFEFTAYPRTLEGRGASRRMRRAGKAPGIVYGGAGAPEPIELDHNALFHALRNEAFHASILAMKLGGNTTKVLLRDVQMHPFKNEILHVDFQRVDENRRIHMKVPLHFVNGETSPAVKLSGAIVSHVTNELDISCLPKDLPEFILVDLASLDVGHSIHVSALKLPPGVTVVVRGKLDPVVAAAVVPKAHVEEEAAAAEAAAGAEAAAPGAAPAPGAPGAAPPTEAKPADKGAEKKEGGKDDRKK